MTSNWGRALAGMVALACFTPSLRGAEALTKEELRCFARGKAQIIGPDKLDVLELHKASPIFAKYDTNCNGKLDPAEVAKMEQDVQELVLGPKRPRELDDLRLRITARGGLPIEEVADPPTPKKPDPSEQRFFLRRDRIDIGLAGSNPDFKDAAGASFSVTRDFEKSETVLNTQAVVSYIMWRNTRAGEGKHPPGEAYVSGYSFAPFFEIDSSTSSKQSTPTRDKLVFGGMGQVEIFSGPVFDRQLISASGYYQTDFFGEARIAGANATWEPTRLRWGLGARTRFTDLFDYTWRIIGSADYRNVDNPGRTSLKADADYLWIGGGTIFKAWPFPDVLESRLYVEAYPTYYYDALSRSDAAMFTGTIGMTLDPNGHAAIQAKYQTGRDYATGTSTRRIVGELAVKY